MKMKALRFFQYAAGTDLILYLLMNIFMKHGTKITLYTCSKFFVFKLGTYRARLGDILAE